MAAVGMGDARFRYSDGRATDRSRGGVARGGEMSDFFSRAQRERWTGGHDVADRELIRSQRALAKALGVSPSTVTGWLKREDCPVKPRGPWSGRELELLSGWRRGLQEDRSGKGDDPGAERAGGGGGGSEAVPGPSQRHKVEVALKFQRMRKAKIEADEAEGRLIERHLLDQGLAGLAAMFVGQLEELEATLPSVLKLNSDQAEQLADRFADARRRLAAHESIELRTAEDAIDAKREGKSKARGRKRAG